jgi:5-methylcytosine-specific restriction endonuclease McrA
MVAHLPLAHGVASSNLAAPTNGIKLAEGKLKADICRLHQYTVLALWVALKDGGMLEDRAKEEAARISEGLVRICPPRPMDIEMEIPTSFNQCTVCGSHEPLTREHIIPQLLGGIHRAYLQCANCNRRMGSEVIAKAKHDPCVRLAVDALKSEIPKLSRTFERGLSYQATDTAGQDVRLVFSGGRCKILAAPGSGCEIVQTRRDFVELCCDEGVPADEAFGHWRAIQETPVNDRLDLPGGLAAVRREVAPRTVRPCLDSQEMDDRLIVLMAYNYLCVLLGAPVLTDSFGPVRQFIRSEGSCPQVFLERLITRSRCYLPGHCIYPETVGGETKIVIRLFGALVYVVHCAGWQMSIKAEPRDALLEFPLR